MNMFRISKKGKRYRKQNSMGINGMRVLASISILALILVLCLWVPLALADDADTATAADTGAAAATPAGQTATDTATGTADTSASSGVSTSTDETSSEPVDNTAEESSQAPATADAPGGDTASAAADDTAGATADATAGTEAAAEGESAAAATAPDTSAATTAATSSDGVTVLASAGAEDCNEAAGAQYGDGCVPEYKLELICDWGENGTYWQSVDDYNNNLLSILYHLANNGTGTAYSLSITSATADNGVTLATDLGTIDLGDLGPGEAITFILKWLLPDELKLTPGSHFNTDIEICADCEQPVCEGDDCPPPDPCELDPSSCQPVDPCIEDPSLCNPIETDDVGPAPTADEVVPVLTRTTLPSTGYSAGNGIIAALALLAVGFLIPLALRSRSRES